MYFIYPQILYDPGSELQLLGLLGVPLLLAQVELHVMTDLLATVRTGNAGEFFSFSIHLEDAVSTEAVSTGCHQAQLDCVQTYWTFFCWVSRLFLCPFWLRKEPMNDEGQMLSLCGSVCPHYALYLPSTPKATPKHSSDTPQN